MTLQSGKNVQVALKRQSALGTPASGASAIGLNINPGQGLKLTKAVINSNAVRKDGQTKRGRHGSRSGDCSYAIELGVGMLDDIIEAAMRGTWTASATITQSAMTSVTTTTSTIVAAAGSWLTQGVRRGDMIKLASFTDAANNGKWFRVVAVTATTITVPANSLVLNATPDTTFSVVVAKTLTNGTTPVERYYTMEEFGLDISKGLLGTDFKVCKLELSIQPDANIVLTATFKGLDVAEQDTTANFSNPVYSTSLPLVMVDGTIRVNGVDYSVLTGFTLTWDMGGSTTPTLSKTSPDVNLSNAKPSGSFTALLADMVFFAAFRAETQVDFFIVMSENEADPADFISVYVGNAVLDGADAPIGDDGAMPVTVPWRAGIDEGGSDRALTTLKWATSAP